MESQNDIIWERAKFLAKRSSRDELHSITILILYDLEIPLNYSGFDYLKHAIPIALERPSQIVLKEIYQEVGKHYSPEVESSTIASGVRDAVEKAWENRYASKWHYYFPEHMLLKNRAPSNVDFIAGMVYFLEMWQGCCKKEVSYAGK